jgi:hypothetical protein
MYKELIIFLLIFISSECFADGVNKIPVAINKFNTSIVNVNNAFDECRKKEERVLQGDIFDNIGISKDQRKIALKYYYFKTATDCSSIAVKDYLLASAIRMFADKSLPRNLRDADELIVSTYLVFLQAEADYSTISDEDKMEFEKIQALQSPFDLIKSAKALGLY